MSNLDALNDALSGGTRWAITGDTPNGEEVGGTILSAEVQQVRNFDTGQPEFWEDGNPMNEIVIEVQTDLRDGENDRGVRAHHVKAWGDQAKELKRALKEAGAGTPAEGLKPGNEFYGTKLRQEQVPGKKFKKNVFAYRVVRNAGAGLTEALAEDPEEQVQAAAPSAQRVRQGRPVQQEAPAAPALDADTERKVKVMLENGFEPDLIASTVGVSVDDVQALAG